jgi:hypothetical protein
MGEGTGRVQTPAEGKPVRFADGRLFHCRPACGIILAILLGDTPFPDPDEHDLGQLVGTIARSR